MDGLLVAHYAESAKLRGGDPNPSPFERRKAVDWASPNTVRRGREGTSQVAPFRFCIVDHASPPLLSLRLCVSEKASTCQSARAAKRWPMIGCGTNTFTDPDDYRRNVPGLNLALVLTGSDTFRSDVTWVQLDHIRLVRIVESAPRIAFVSLAPAPVFVSFPLHSDPQPVWNGVHLRRGEIILHSGGEHFHQLTIGSARWGLISLSPEQLHRFSRTLTGRNWELPKVARLLRMPPSIAGHFLRLYTQACDLARLRPDLMAHREVARALEQDLIHALVQVLTCGEPHSSSATRQRHAVIMDRFERVLVSQYDRPLPTPALCAAIGVPERTLRMCCAEFVGRSPVSYARLRRLNLVRSALMRSNPATANIATMARNFGFSEPGRFAAAYRSVFGETPSVTLRRSMADDLSSFDPA